MHPNALICSFCGKEIFSRFNVTATARGAFHTRNDDGLSCFRLYMAILLQQQGQNGVCYGTR